MEKPRVSYVCPWIVTVHCHSCGNSAHFDVRRGEMYEFLCSFCGHKQAVYGTNLRPSERAQCDRWSTLPSRR